MCYLRTPLWSRQFPQSKSELCNSDIGIEVPWQLTQPLQDGGHSCGKIKTFNDFFIYVISRMSFAFVNYILFILLYYACEEVILLLIILIFYIFLISQEIIRYSDLSRSEF